MKTKKKIYILICFLNIIALLFTESRGSIAALIFMFAVVFNKRMVSVEENCSEVFLLF